MPACKFETFKRTAHPSQNRTNVLFCRCPQCSDARAYTTGGIDLPPRVRSGVRTRVTALRWTPPEPPETEGADEPEVA